jgi:hypothetical protein
VNVRLVFAGDSVEYARKMHVGFGETTLPTLVGIAQ